MEVRVTDTNDNVPQFDQAIYNFNISENLGVNGFVGVISAVDSDATVNGLVTYGIESGNDAGHFSINLANGQITLAASVDFEVPAQKVFKLRVVASDQGVPNPLQNRTDANIYVLDFNDNAPIPVTAVGSIRENATVNTVAVTLIATDADSTINKRLQFR